MQKQNQESLNEKLYYDHVEFCNKAFGLPYDLSTKVTIQFSREEVENKYIIPGETGFIWKSKVLYITPYALPESYKDILTAEAPTFDECLEIISQSVTMDRMRFS